MADGNSGQTSRCNVCETPTRTHCKACCTTYYCSKEHQKADWKVHKLVCFPVKNEKRSGYGRVMLATREIKQGQKILEESPIFSTPNTRTERGITCLGCCKKLTNSNISPCIRCGWPLCDIQCPLEEVHSSNECRILQERQITCPLGTLGNAYQTLCEIGVLRLLLLRKRDPTKWKEIEKMDPFKEARERIPDTIFSLQSAFRFIKEECSFEDADDDLIDTAFGILRGNTFDTSDYFGFIQCCSEDIRCASLLFQRAVIPGPNCVPNASYSIVGRDDGNYRFICFATSDIEKGEVISIPYEDDFSGTLLRRKVKESVFYQNCSCKLCNDPTELGTHLSSLKCTKSNCTSGIIMSTNPLLADAEWKCNQCSELITHLQMMAVLQNAKSKLQESVNKATLDESLRSIMSVRNTFLHENHFMVLQTEMEMCRRILSVIGFYEIKNIAENLSTILESLVEMSKHLLSIADVLRPGYSRTRGRLLYCLQFGMLVTLLSEQRREETSNKRKFVCRFDTRKTDMVNELKRIQEEAEKILALETDLNSEEHRMLKTLRGELKTAVLTIR